MFTVLFAKCGLQGSQVTTSKRITNPMLLSFQHGYMLLKHPAAESWLLTHLSFGSLT